MSSKTTASPSFSAGDASLYSSLFESVLEHLFSGAVMKQLWLNGVRSIEVLHSSVDNNGYDIVVEVQNIVRHIQLKGFAVGGRTASWKVHTNLTQKPAGCLVVIGYDPTTLDLVEFHWFGNRPKEPFTIPSDAPIAKHTKANAEGVKAERPNIRVITKSRMTHFTGEQRVRELVATLFGDALVDEASVINRDPLGTGALEEVD